MPAGVRPRRLFFVLPVRDVLKVTVLEINGGKVRLGFDVDRDIPVHRLEVWERLGEGGPNGAMGGSAAPAVG
jgi:sRNA-binding carbon storage regulator CsrA